MAESIGRYLYLQADGASLFTAVLLPDEDGQFPTVIFRSPYVDGYEKTPEDSIVEAYKSSMKGWLDAGYAVVYQHCRGRGKSSGDCIPYINERADGLLLQSWIRTQPFYNGELFLDGGSYLTSVHYATAPFADDIKGAVFGIQDTERYNLCYRNGFFKSALHGGWYVGMYKAKSHMKKYYAAAAFDTLPLTAFTETVFGEPVPDFDDMLRSPDPGDPFWQTHAGGTDARGATEHARIPILLTTGFYDIYTGGIFDMWNRMDEETRSQSALVVSPYSHGDSPNDSPIRFPAGTRFEGFGSDYEIRWFDHIRGKRPESPFAPGKVTYYSLFENTWKTDDFSHTEEVRIPIGSGTHTYTYNPFNPPSLVGGLSTNFGGSAYQHKPGSRPDILTFFTEPFAEDTLVRGKMTADLRVSSDCEDTCFLMRISIRKEDGDYGLRDDITNLIRQAPDFRPGDTVSLTFSFDEHAFLIRAGEVLRIDITSADNAHYVRHTNKKGLYSEQETAVIAHNTVFMDGCTLTLPVVSNG